MESNHGPLSFKWQRGDNASFMVGTEGIEPSASVLSGQRSTIELRAHKTCVIPSEPFLWVYPISGQRSTIELRARCTLSRRGGTASIPHSHVRLGGIGPPAFCVSCKRSTTELKAHSA